MLSILFCPFFIASLVCFFILASVSLIVSCWASPAALIFSLLSLLSLSAAAFCFSFEGGFGASSTFLESFALASAFALSPAAFASAFSLSIALLALSSMSFFLSSGSSFGASPSFLAAWSFFILAIASLFSSANFLVAATSSLSCFCNLATFFLFDNILATSILPWIL